MASWLVTVSVFAVVVASCGGRQDGGHDEPADAGHPDASTSSSSSGVNSSSSSGVSSSSGSSSGAALDATVTTNLTLALRNQAVQKLDVLFMIDNSSSMGDKQDLLAAAIPDMINRLVAPNCLDANGVVLGPSVNGTCPTGHIEFEAVHDMHLGIVSSSLGGRGSSTICSATDVNPANTALNAHNDDRGELINRGGPSEVPVPNAGSPLNFLSWFPPIAENQGPGAVPPPTPAETAVGDMNTSNTLIGDFTQMVIGVHEHGCGFEAQNEAWYRFLVQPDPYQSIVVNSNLQASYAGTDSVILTQRAAFLRPDSLLAIVVVSDESQETADPLSLDDLGYLFETSPWPSSPTTAAPEGTVACLSNPLDPACTSCSILGSTSPSFAAECPNDPPNGTQGYLDPSDDNINVRFFHQKQRFGVSAGYPSSRYVVGLTSPNVPDRAHEVDSAGNYIGDQRAQQNCVNPIFAMNLPTSATADLCNLQPGPRTPDLVYYAVIGGVPHQLLQAAPGDPECPAGTAAADCPQKNLLTSADWLKMTGADPENYDFTGADFHMLESEAPRGPCSPTSADTCDPINGREWDTVKQDLQFACIFDLPAPKDCTQAQFIGACDCAPGSNSASTPLCQMDGNGHYTTTQIKGKAYPALAELEVAHAMATQPSGVQAIVSSLCPIHTTPASTSDPVYGYRPAMNAIVNRLKTGLSAQCLPQMLTPDPTTQAVPCLILATLASQGPETVCANTPGLAQPPADVLAAFQAGPHAAWLAAGGPNGGQPDPSSLPTCVVSQLTPAADPVDFLNGTCLTSMDPGWCYVQSPAAGGCAQQIAFSAGMPPRGATLALQCQTP
jgi:hypothetical protein